MFDLPATPFAISLDLSSLLHISLCILLERLNMQGQAYCPFLNFLTFDLLMWPLNSYDLLWPHLLPAWPWAAVIFLYNPLARLNVQGLFFIILNFTTFDLFSWPLTSLWPNFISVDPWFIIISLYSLLARWNMQGVIYFPVLKILTFDLIMWPLASLWPHLLPEWPWTTIISLHNPLARVNVQGLTIFYYFKFSDLWPT